MATAAGAAEYFASLDPNEEVLWQAFTRSDVESMTSEEMSDDLWQEVVLLYDKNPATFEDFGIGDLITYAAERLEE